MDEDGQNRVRDRSFVDRLSSLPDSLLCQILLNLPTEDVVKTSVLSTRWTNLWRYVPGLDLTHTDFPDNDTFVSFIDRFLSFNSESLLQNFKLKYDCDEDEETEFSQIIQWINIVLKRKVQYLHVLDRWLDEEVEMPPSLYTCESLISLKLCGLTLASPGFVSLPSLRVLELMSIVFADDLALEKLISRCPALESLDIGRSLCDNTEVLRVCSQSLLSFSYTADGSEGTVEELAVVIDAPRLRFLRVSDARTATYILSHSGSLVKVDIDTDFNLCFGRTFSPNDLPKRDMIRKFFVAISCVKDMSISTDTLEVVYDYSRCAPLPLFRNLSSLRVEFSNYLSEMLSFFLERCPNLKSLVVFKGPSRYQEWERINFLPGPRSLLSSLEYVEIEKPLKGKPMEIKLVSYLLNNSPILKKLTLCLNDSVKKQASVILREILTIPRLSTSCQVVVTSSSGVPYGYYLYT